MRYSDNWNLLEAPEIRFWETKPVGNAGLDLATRLFVKIGVEQFSKAFSVQPVCGASASPVQPAKQILQVHFVDFWSFMYFNDEILSSIGFVEGLTG